VNESRLGRQCILYSIVLQSEKGTRSQLGETQTLQQLSPGSPAVEDGERGRVGREVCGVV